MVGMLAKGCEMEDIAALFRALDTNADGAISKEEFLSGIPKFASLIGGVPTPEPEKPIVHDINKWGRKVFAQFDANRDGRMSMKELTRGLKALPKTKPVSAPQGTKFLSVEELIASLDKDANGYLDLHEWLTMLKDCAGLEAAIAEAVDETGELSSYRSLDDQLAKRIAQIAAYAEKKTLSESEEAEKAEYERQAASLQAKIDEAQLNEGAR